MLKRKSTRNELIILLSLLALIVVLLVSYEIHIYTYNHTQRSFDGQSEKASSLSIVPRSGSTDSWVKNVEHDAGVRQYFGVIYDMTLTNYTPSAVSEWTLTIRIPEKCYLNNAWCGLVEVHQFENGQENVQTLDLRDYSEADITLQHMVESNDLMIPLSQGDFLVYHPSFSADEFPIPACIRDKTSPVVAGLIFYTEDDHTMAFDDYEVDYLLHTKFESNPISTVILALGALWIILFLVFGATELSMRRAQIRYQQDERIIHQSIGVFTHFFEAKDIYTNGHSQRVAQYAKLVAEKMNMTEEECRNIYYTALMHDCGKCYIPDAVLKKDGKLTDEEYAIIKSHTVKGAEMLRDFTAIDHVGEGARYHHERYDGKGYPEGLKGEEIPLVSRIICICDSFDAMNSQRCYRGRLSREKILQELEECSGKQFDPEMVKIFLSLIQEGKIKL